MQGSISNPNRWDNELNPLPCDRYNNTELTIFLRVFLQQVNPAGGAAAGTAREWGAYWDWITRRRPVPPAPRLATVGRSLATAPHRTTVPT
jgi:hypothetical protein